jgi:ABC-type multidrug transport system fused ATPase/permease subunit
MRALPDQAGRDGQAALPKLLVGPRRRLMALLIGTGMVLAALSGASAYLMAHLLAVGAPARILAVASLTVAACGLGMGRVAERVLAERLGQHYVQEIRTGLMAAILADPGGSSPGIAIARITNDLTSVRNWITMGIAPLVVGVPLIAGATIALWFMSPPLALAVAIPLCLFSGAIAALSRPAFTRARVLRKNRGRLAARVSDTVTAATAIRAAGGQQREVRQIERLGGQVAAAAIQRAKIGGYIRGSASIAGALTGVTVAATGSSLSVPTATIAAALSVVGLLSSHVNELGRVAEYRQTFNAARMMIGQSLARAAPGIGREGEDLPPQQTPGAAATGTAAGGDAPDSLVRISGLKFRGNRPLPELRAMAGDRIYLKSSEPGEAAEIFEMLLGVRISPGLDIWVDGQNLAAAPASTRRRLAGYAVAGAFIERGTIARALRYRRPDLPLEVTPQALARVGLAVPVARLPKAEHTILRRGGDPLSMSERARLQIARAVLGDPPMLLLNHIDFDLGAEGRSVLAQILDSYPGVAIIASDRPDLLVREYVEWDLR